MTNSQGIFCCRSCLIENTEFISLLDEPINSTYLECTSIQVTAFDLQLSIELTESSFQICRDEGLSTWICLSCVERCRAAYSFREQAIASDEKLRFAAETQEVVTMATDFDCATAEEPPKEEQSLDDKSAPEVDPFFELGVNQYEEEEIGDVEKTEEEVVMEEIVIDNEVVVEEEEEELYMSDVVEEYEQIVYEFSGEEDGESIQENPTTKTSSKSKDSQVS